MSKAAQQVLDSVFAFPPNRETLGGTAYFIVGNPWNILVDCPAWTPENQSFIASHGPVQWLAITHRQGIGAHISQMQQTLACQIAIQEQEAYLLPNLPVTAFQDRLSLSDDSYLLWTPGHSPGSACCYDRRDGVLFTGRHLLPNSQGQPTPLRTAKTFHWPRQIRSLEKLQTSFTSETLQFICPGANTGFLRGRRVIDHAYQAICNLQSDRLRWVEIHDG
ncbi:MAG: MBL fold metallo-hydrolase [Cyanobacteria bacterium P01_A01_bin.17]